jgi:hypothetical protein
MPNEDIDIANAETSSLNKRKHEEISSTKDNKNIDEGIYPKLIECLKSDSYNISDLNDTQKEALTKARVNAYYKAHITIGGTEDNSNLNYNNVYNSVFHDSEVNIKNGKLEDGFQDLMTAKVLKEFISEKESREKSIIEKYTESPQKELPVNRSKAILTQEDISILYNNVANDESQTNLSYSQRVYLKGAISDSYFSMRELASQTLGNDKTKMQFIAINAVQWSRESYENGEVEKALAQQLDGKSMTALVEEMEQGKDDLYKQAARVVGV